MRDNSTNICDLTPEELVSALRSVAGDLEIPAEDVDACVERTLKAAIELAHTDPSWTCDLPSLRALMSRFGRING